MGLVAHAAHADDEVRHPAIHIGHEVEEPGPAREEYLRPAEGDLGRRLLVPFVDRAVREPHLDQGA